MARCVVGKGPRSIRRSDAPNTMARCACSMLPASLTVAPGLLPHPLSRTWHRHQKTSSCQCCPASPASACGRRADAFEPCCSFPSSSSHLVGGLVTHAASPSLDPLAAQPPGHRASSTQFTTSLHAFCFLARRASALAHDVATTARAQCPTTQRSACRDYCLWTLNGVCPGPGFAGRLN
jgi:hypothetical protein